MKNRFSRQLPALFIAAALLLLSGCKEIYVKAGATGEQNGTKDAPFATIQQAMDAAKTTEGNVVVWVAEGQYLENIVVPENTALVGEGFKTQLRGAKWLEPTVRAGASTLITGMYIEGARPIRITVDEKAARETRVGVVGNALVGSIPLLVEVMSSVPDGERHVGVVVERNCVNGGSMWLAGKSFAGKTKLSLDVEDNQMLNGGVVVSGQDSVGETQVAGWVRNNLMIGGTNGVLLEAGEQTDVSPFIYNNTIAGRAGFFSSAGIRAVAKGGGVRAKVFNNVMSRINTGFWEGSLQTSPSIFAFNVSDGNQVHYADADVPVDIIDEVSLNTPIQGGKVIYHSGGNNSTGDPGFMSGPSSCDEIADGYGDFYLLQKTLSSAFDSGNLPVADHDWLLPGHTTDVNGAPDTGQIDRGFHYHRRRTH